MRISFHVPVVPVVATLATSALLAPLAVAAPASAGTATPTAPTITRVTTENDGGGLTPYVPLATSAVVVLTDATPSAADDYRLVVAGLGTFPVRESWDTPGSFEASVPNRGFADGRRFSFTVQELSSNGRVVGTSAARTWTWRYVGHPRRLDTNARKVHGRWTYRAGSVARFRFRGTWEPGTRFTTQVFVSRTRTYTGDDYAANVNGHAALVSTRDAARPVLSVRVPRRLVGRHLWVSVLGWKNGKAGWVFQTGPAQVTRR